MQDVGVRARRATIGSGQIVGRSTACFSYCHLPTAFCLLRMQLAVLLLLFVIEPQLPAPRLGRQHPVAVGDLGYLRVAEIVGSG